MYDRLLHNKTGHRHERGRGLPHHSGPSHLDAPVSLARMLQEAKEAGKRFAKEGNVTVSWERIWNIEPILFQEELIAFSDEAIRENRREPTSSSFRTTHDAAEVARAGVPTIMMFVQSLPGLVIIRSRTRRKSISRWRGTAFDKLASKTMAWIAGQAKERPLSLFQSHIHLRDSGCLFPYTFC